MTCVILRNCINVHEHRDELLQLMEQQLIDDSYHTVTTDT